MCECNGKLYADRICLMRHQETDAHKTNLTNKLKRERESYKEEIAALKLDIKGLKNMFKMELNLLNNEFNVFKIELKSITNMINLMKQHTMSESSCIKTPESDLYDNFNKPDDSTTDSSAGNDNQVNKKNFYLAAIIEHLIRVEQTDSLLVEKLSELLNQNKQNQAMYSLSD